LFWEKGKEEEAAVGVEREGRGAEGTEG